MSSTPSSCPDTNNDGIPDPSINLTVTSSITGDITWCGETWSLPDDNGDTREVCPSIYNIEHDSTGSGQTGRETWKYSENTTLNTQGLRLSRRYQYLTNDHMYALRAIYLGGNDKKKASWFGSPPKTTHIYCNLSVYCTPGADTTIDSYSILSGQFGSYTDNNITYTWERGNGW